MAAARQDGSRDMCLTGPTGDVLAPSSSAAPEEILPTPADGGIYSDDCNQAFPSKLHWDNTFTVKKEPIEFPPPWSVEDRGLGAPDCMSSLQGQTEGRCRNCFLHETHVPGPCPSAMPEEILPTLTGRSVCSEDQGTLSTSQMHLEGHWNFDVVVKEEPEEAYAPSTCEGSCSEAADTPFSYHDQLDGGLSDNVVVKEEMEETLPDSTGEGFCPEDNNEMSLSLLDLEGHCSGARAVKKEPEERLLSPARDSSGSEDHSDASPFKRRPKKRRSNNRAAKKGPRRARRVRGSYTILKKVNVVEWHRQNGNNVSKTARQFDIDRKRIRDWNANYQSLLQQCQGENRVKRSMGKGRPVFSKEIDNALVSFLEDERLAGRPVSNRLLQAHARQLAAKMGLGGFQASHQYLTRWKRRFNVSLRARTNENQKRPIN